MTTDYADVDHLTEGQAADLHALYQREWWTRGRTLEQTLEMLRNTDHVLGVCDAKSGRLLAFARVLTDGVFRAFVYDVIVAEELRGRGLGSRLMRRLLEHPVLRGVSQVDLACRPEREAFYRRLGFTTELGGTRLMRRCRSA